MVNRYTSDRRIRSDDAYSPGRRRRAAARPLGHRLRPALPRGVPRRAAGDRRHRGQPAADRPLRLLVGEGPALDPARRQGRPAGVRQRRAGRRRDRPPPGGGRAHRPRSTTSAAPRSLRRRGRPAGLDRDRLARGRHPGARRAAARSVRRRAPDGERLRRRPHRRRRRSSRAWDCASARTAPAPSSACPTFDAVAADPVLYAHASRLLHLEANPGNARGAGAAPRRLATSG